MPMNLKKKASLLVVICITVCSAFCSCHKDALKPTPQKEEADPTIVLEESDIVIRLGQDVEINLKEGKVYSHQVEPSGVLVVTYEQGGKAISLHPETVGLCRVQLFNKAGTQTDLRVEVTARALQATALEYISPYNVAHDGISFDKTGSPEGSALYGWQEAKSRFTDITIDGQGWHLPTFKEWIGVMSEFPNVVYYGKQDTLRNSYERVVINGVEVEGASEFFNTTTGITYAVRFKGTDYCSAWRYSYERYKDKQHKFQNKLVITARPISPDLAISADRNLTRREFWEQDSNLDKTIALPATGCVKLAEDPNAVTKQGDSGFYWASDVYLKDGEEYPNIFYFNSMYLLPSYYTQPNDRFAVRLFKN